MNIANEYWCKHFPALDTGRKETPYGYKIRNTWRDLGFPSYPTVDEYLGLPKNTTNVYANKYGYTDIKNKYEELKEQIKRENEEKEQIELITTFKEIWNTTINDTKYQLQGITQEIQKIENQINNTNDAEIKKALQKRLDELWEKHNNIVINKFPKLQDKARTNLGLTNTYKDNTIDKLEVEQKGELTLNQNIKQAPTEELLKKYADYIERIDKTTENNLDG